MFHGDLVNELHIQDAATPGFKKFWKKWMGEAKMPGEGPYFVQFTKPRSADDKRFVGQALGKPNPYEEDPESLEPPTEDDDKGTYVKQKRKRDAELKQLSRMGLEDPTLYKKPDHADPIGAYVYPLEYVINHPYDIQYGHNMEFLRVIKLRDNAKILHLQNVGSRHLAEFAKAMGWGDFGPLDILDAVKGLSKGRKGNQMAHSLWFMIQHEGRIYRTKDRPKLSPEEFEKIEDDDDDGEAKQGKVAWWGGKGNPDTDGNMVSNYKSVLPQKEQTARIKKFGYDVLLDLDETGDKAVIYHGEPEQALIISRNAYDVVDTYDLRVNKKTSYGAMSYKGISRDASREQKRFPREVAEKISKIIGDKIEGAMKLGDSSNNYTEMEGSLSDAVRYLNGEDPLTLAMSSGSDMTSPKFFQTKRGIMAIDIDTAKTEKSGHRSMDWSNNDILSVDYIDERGLSHYKGASLTIANIGAQILNKHPQMPLKMKEPLTVKQINRAKLAIGQVKIQFEQLQDTMDTDFVQLPHKLNQIAQTLKIPTIPTHNDVAEDLGYYALIRGMSENFSASDYAYKLGIDNLSLDEDDNICEQSKEIATLRDKSEAWFRTTKGNTVNADAAKDLKGKADWIYAFGEPGVYLKLHPEAEPIIRIMQWIYIIMGNNAGVLDTRKYSNFESGIDRALKEAEEMAKNKDLWRACNPKNIGDASEYKDSMSLKSREMVGNSLRYLADSLAGIGHKILKVQAEDEGAQSINRLRDKISDLGFALKRIIDKDYTPSNANLENALKLLDQHLDEMLQLFHLEDHPSIPDGEGMPADEMDPIKTKLKELAGAMELSQYVAPNWSNRIMHRVRLLGANRNTIHSYRTNSLVSSFGDEATTKWLKKYGTEARLGRRAWDPEWQDGIEAQDKAHKELLAKKQQEMKDKNAAKAAEDAHNAAEHQKWLKKMQDQPDQPAPF
jgi:hypothetical protein